MGDFRFARLKNDTTERVTVTIKYATRNEPNNDCERGYTFNASSFETAINSVQEFILKFGDRGHVIKHIEIDGLHRFAH